MLDARSTLQAAAQMMRDEDIGDVIVIDDDQLCGIVTDRDIAVRAVADGKDPTETRLGHICSRDLVTIAPNDPAEHAVELMRKNAMRRMPVVESGRPVGIVSLGDLALDRDRNSALADISAAPANN
jgi:CBS domain-containing protein